MEVLLKIQWLFVILFSLFAYEIEIHAHLSKCCWGAWSEKHQESWL